MRANRTSPKAWAMYVTMACLLIFTGSLSACGQKSKTTTATVPIDTTIVDDDTLEVDDVTKSKQTEHAR